MNLSGYTIEQLVELKNEIKNRIYGYKDGYFYICNVRSYGRNWKENINNKYTLQELCYRYNGDDGIVDEGVDMDLCQIDDFDEYFKQVVNGSAMTYLFNYFDNHLEEGYKEMEKYMIDYIKKNFTNRITEFWEFNKEDC
jgi:hypothetical protein